MRLLAGSKGTNPRPLTKKEYVGVAPAAMLETTVGVGALLHVPFGNVSHTFTAMGRLPLFADTWIWPPAPTFEVATAKAAAPLFPGMLTMRPGTGVAASAMMSGPGAWVAASSSVLTPLIGARGKVLAPAKMSCTSLGGRGEEGVIENTKVCAPPGG